MISLNTTSLLTQKRSKLLRLSTGNLQDTSLKNLSILFGDIPTTGR
ncbi:hypothetical protein PSPO01_15875 [Paraphaeosphaeria sporulosa]